MKFYSKILFKDFIHLENLTPVVRVCEVLEAPKLGTRDRMSCVLYSTDICGYSRRKSNLNKIQNSVVH